MGQGDAQHEEVAGEEGFAKRRGDSSEKDVKIGRGKVPPNGWHFQVAPGIMLEAINEEELVKQIFEYRLRHNIPVGDIERDIDDYYCTRWPKACHKEPKDWVNDGNPESVSSEPMLNRVTRWAALMVHGQPRGGYSLVGVEEANRRGLICVGCPKNQPWRTGCTGCSSSSATVLAQLRKLQSSKQQGNLMGCKVAGWDNATAVWMPKEALALTESQLKDLPDRCWKKA